MDCSIVDLLEQHQQQQQQHQQQFIQNRPIQYQQQQQQEVSNLAAAAAALTLDDSIRTLTNLADTCRSTCSGSISGSAAVGTTENSTNLGGGFYSSPTKSVAEINCNNNNNNNSVSSSASGNSAVKLRKFVERGQIQQVNNAAALTGVESKSKSHTYRISMANLEETQESELDVILGELSLLEAQINCVDGNFSPAAAGPGGMTTPSAPSTRTHSRTNSTLSAATSISGSSESGSATHSTCSSSGISENGGHLSGSSSSSISQSTNLLGNGGGGNGPGNSGLREPRTESPDNDSAFSDTVSLLSSESSASSGMSSALHHKRLMVPALLPVSGNTKAAKIQLALHKLESAPIRRLFVKAFTADGASKSLLVDERMTCGHVTRLLADKNHVQMQPNWALVESLGDLQMERLFEDHELLVDNLMTWNSDAGNRVLFQQRSDKISLFIRPELYLPGPQMAPGSQHDEHTRSMLLEEFFETQAQLQVDGPLYMKADSKKGWKRYHFVLRSSGLYYFSKEKTKSPRDLACLTLFNGYNVYRGLGWRKKWKAPSDYTFGFKSAVDSSLGKSCRTLKMLCAEDLETMEKWLTAIRVAKYGKQLWDNHKILMEELSSGDGISQSSFGVSMRSESISSISSAVPSQCGSVSSAVSSMSNSSGGGRMSRASSSSSSGCLSDDNNGFDSEFTTGTIKRKPSMKPNLPLTTMTRQLKEVGEITQADNTQELATSPERSGTLTRRHSRRKSQESNGSGGTLKRRPQGSGGTMHIVGGSGSLTKRSSAENMNANNSSGSSNSTPTPTPSICNKPLVATSYDIMPSTVTITTQLQTPTGVLSCNVDGMTSSTLSLDSLPPPPPPPVLNECDQDPYGSQMSLLSLPPPPPPLDDVNVNTTSMIYNEGTLVTSNKALPPAVPAKPIKSAVKTAPPYKNPPDYKGNIPSNHNSSIMAPPPSAPVQKKVSFADSPVLLRRKMHSPEIPKHDAEPFYAPGPVPPPRNDLTRYSNCSSIGSSVSQQEYGSPKRLQESTANPPRDFLKDLQRVMRKKWQVAQKCKQEPATTPHEVLGFRDFSSDELLAHNLSNNSHFYRETANVSNWVQEHYGAGAPPAPPPINEYALYENVHGSVNGPGVSLMEPQYATTAAPTTVAPTRDKVACSNSNSANNINNGSNNLNKNLQKTLPMNTTTAIAPPTSLPASTTLPSSVHTTAIAAAAGGIRKKRPPPPPPKRSDSTHLSTHNRV